MGSIDRTLGRREFVRRAAAGAAGLTLLSRRARSRGPRATRFVVAHIGLGGMGRAHLRWFADFDDVEIAALCDVDGSHLGRALGELYERRPGSRTEAYLDFRRVLDRTDIDAVTCATPDHWHALVATMAFQSGKDVYGEKPLAYCAQEGRAMLDAMEANDRIFQLGTQIHAGDNYHRVVELVRSGVLGEIRTVHIWKTGGSPGMGFPGRRGAPRDARLRHVAGTGPGGGVQPGAVPLALPLLPRSTPAGCTRTSGVTSPTSSSGPWSRRACAACRPGASRRGTASPMPRRGSTWTSPSRTSTSTGRPSPPTCPGPRTASIGACFVGSKGTLLCDYDTREIRIDGELLEDIPEVPETIPRSPGHQRNFLDSVKSRTPPESNLHYARQMTLPMHLGLISWRLGRPLEWDPEKERFVGDAAADYLLSRNYRSPWTLGPGARHEEHLHQPAARVGRRRPRPGPGRPGEGIRAAVQRPGPGRVGGGRRASTSTTARS